MSKSEDSILTRLPAELRENVRSFKPQYDDAVLLIHSIESKVEDDESIALRLSGDGKRVIADILESCKNHEWDFGDPDDEMFIKTRRTFSMPRKVDVVMAFIRLRIGIGLNGKKKSATALLAPAHVYDIEKHVFTTGSSYCWELSKVFDNRPGRSALDDINTLKLFCELFVDGIQLGHVDRD